jgi:MFS family permease
MFAGAAGAPDSRALDSPRAWLMAATAFLSCFVVFGVMYSFGAFFKPIAAEFGANRASTSVVFSLTAAIYAALGLVAGRLGDRFGPRPVILVGAVALGAGLIATASAHTLTVVYLTYGIGVGIGIASGYVPMLAVVGGWFERRRNAAMGVAVAGIGAGTLAVAPVAAVLIDHFGWRVAYRLIGGVGAVTLMLCAIVAEAPPRPPAHRRFVSPI